MGARGRRTLTLAATGLVLVAGCTAGGPPDPPVAPIEAPPLPAASPSSGRPADRVLGVTRKGRTGAATASLAWLDPLTLRPRPGRRLHLGRHGDAWAVAPDRSLALFAGADGGSDRRLLVVDPAASAGWARSGCGRGGGGRTPGAGSAGRGWCWPAPARPEGRRATWPPRW
jgi:hypothetical protein